MALSQRGTPGERCVAILPGQYFDAETGLHQNWHRTYDPSIGRYLEADPIGLRGGLNPYAYSLSRPTSLTDVLGLWSPGGHDKILDDTFGDRLPPNEVETMKNASRAFDKRTQSTEESHKHCMRRKKQKLGEAILMRDQFIEETLGDARYYSGVGRREDSLTSFGEACHPIMDCSSPEHQDEIGNMKEWNPWWPVGHSPNDLIGNETVDDLTSAILKQQKDALGRAYDSVYGK